MYATSITGINYLVAGKQKQWGQFVLNNSGLSSANTLPLSFSNKNYVLTPYLAVQKNAYIDAYVNYYSASQFKYFGGAGTYRYIASGW